MLFVPFIRSGNIVEPSSNTITRIISRLTCVAGQKQFLISGLTCWAGMTTDVADIRLTHDPMRFLPRAHFSLPL